MFWSLQSSQYDALKSKETELGRTPWYCVCHCIWCQSRNPLVTQFNRLGQVIIQFTHDLVFVGFEVLTRDLHHAWRPEGYIFRMEIPQNLFPSFTIKIWKLVLVQVGPICDRIVDLLLFSSSQPAIGKTCNRPLSHFIPTRWWRTHQDFLLNKLDLDIFNILEQCTWSCGWSIICKILGFLTLSHWGAVGISEGGVSQTPVIDHEFYVLLRVDIWTGPEVFTIFQMIAHPSELIWHLFISAVASNNCFVPCPYE